MHGGWDEDDLDAATWWVAAGWAELLIEPVTDQRGEPEIAARDTLGLAVMLGVVRHHQRPGLIRLDEALSAARTPRQLEQDLDEALPDWRRHTDRDLDEGQAVLAAVADHHTDQHMPIEDRYPGGHLLSRGGGAVW